MLRMSPALPAIAVTLVLAACAGGGGSPEPQAGRQTALDVRANAATPAPLATSTPQSILPSKTDSKIVNPDRAHLAINPNPGTTPRNKLFVFLPGTAANPGEYTDIVEEAAAKGYHAIGLDYPNAVEVDVLCENQGLDCYGNLHNETITGENTSPQVDVTPTNSITHRLVALLQYLQKNSGSQGWGQYLTPAGDVAWGSVVISGHSQGGGHAAYLAKVLHAVSRVCVFSAPDDEDQKTLVAATWIGDGAHQTDPALFSGLINTGDNVEVPQQVYDIWASIGFTGALTSIDGAQPPYGGSHRLTTSIPSPNNRDPFAAHDETVLDASTPVDANGIPINAPAWDNDCFS